METDGTRARPEGEQEEERQPKWHKDVSKGKGQSLDSWSGWHRKQGQGKAPWNQYQRPPVCLQKCGGIAQPSSPSSWLIT